MSADLHGNTLRNTATHWGFGADTSAGLAQGLSHASIRDSFPGRMGLYPYRQRSWATMVLRLCSTFSRTSVGTCIRHEVRCTLQSPSRAISVGNSRSRTAATAATPIPRNGLAACLSDQWRPLILIVACYKWSDAPRVGKRNRLPWRRRKTSSHL